MPRQAQLRAGRAALSKAKEDDGALGQAQEHGCREADEPAFRTVRLYDLRHFAATMMYHRTKDILYTQKMLGHRNLKSTLRYVQLIGFEEDDYTSAVAETLQETRQLIEAGFEYVTEMEGAKIFRKRK